MTDSRRGGDDGGHREVLARRRPAADRPRDQAGRTSGPVLGGSVRIVRIGSLPSAGPPSVAEAVVHRVTRCPARVARTGDPGSATAGEDLAGERAAGDQQAGEALAQLGHPRRALGAEEQPRVGRQHVGLGLDAGAQVLALGGQPAVVEQAALDQRGGLRGPLLVAPAAGRLGRRQREPAAGGGVRDQRLEAVEVGVQQGGDVPVAAVLAQQRRRVPEVEQRLVGPGQVGVPGVERAALGGQRVARLAQQPGQLGELRGVDRLLAEQPGERGAGDVPAGPRPPAPGRRGSRPAGSCARPATARSCRRSPSPRRRRRRPSARPGRRSRTSGPGADRAR